MKIVHLVSWFDSVNEVDYEAAFLGQTLLDAWHTEDSSWHGENYDVFLEKIGIKIEYRLATDFDEKAIRNHFDID